MRTAARLSRRGSLCAAFIFGSLSSLIIAISLPGPLLHLGSTSPSDSIVATVGSRPITLRDVEQAAAMALYQADQQRDTILRKVLHEKIDEELLAGHAADQGVTVEQLLSHASESQDIARLANLPAPVRQLGAEWDMRRVNPIPSQDIREQARIRQALLVSLRRKVQIKIALPEVPPPIISVSTGNHPSQGPAEAPITIVIFSDFQCPYCRLSVPLIKELLQEYPQDVKVVYRNYPGPNHPYANQAAEAAQCAGAQGRFWEYHDLLFQQQSAMGWDVTALANELSLDSLAFNRCLNTGRYREEVRKDFQEAIKLGISSTPTFLVNGRPLVGAHPLADFKMVIDPLIKEGKSAGTDSRPGRRP